MINENWQLNIPCSDYGNIALMERYEKVIFMAQDLLDYRLTVREVARNYCLGKSTVSRWFEKYLKGLDYDLYREVKTQLGFHKKHTSGWRHI